MVNIGFRMALKEDFEYEPLVSSSDYQTRPLADPLPVKIRRTQYHSAFTVGLLVQLLNIVLFLGGYAFLRFDYGGWNKSSNDLDDCEFGSVVLHPLSKVC